MHPTLELYTNVVYLVGIYFFINLLITGILIWILRNDLSYSRKEDQGLVVLLMLLLGIPVLIFFLIEQLRS